MIKSGQVENSLIFFAFVEIVLKNKYSLFTLKEKLVESEVIAEL